MLMPKKNLVAIYEHLFKEGVMVAKKDTHLPKHPEIDVPNLQVIKTLNVSISLSLITICFLMFQVIWEDPSHLKLLNTLLRITIL